MAGMLVRRSLHKRYLLQVSVCLPDVRLGSTKAKNNQRFDQNEEAKFRSSKHVLCGALVAAGMWGFYDFLSGRKRCSNVVLADTLTYGHFRKELPTYTLDDVSKHDGGGKEKRVWVSYRQGVYDITDFIPKHPGGDKIMIAAGGSVEPFWLLYAVHKTPSILTMLEEYRIGNLSKDDSKIALSNTEDPYAKEPRRHPALRPSSVKPFNAEPPLSILADNFITPSELFYVRNHLPVPEIDMKSYELEVTGIGIKTKCLTLDNLKKFPKHTITATVQCAGNRRSEMVKVKPVKGLNWGQAAIGNATWSGARLVDVLRAAGLNEETTQAEHVQFEGLDTDPSNVPYGASIPIEKAIDPLGDVLLAYEMNGQPIPLDHGYPVRVIVPGVVGARNVKWLSRIEVSKEESKSHWQQGDYKGFSPSVDWDTVDFSKSPAIQELPVISAICEPLDGETVHLEDCNIHVKGYAWSGGGRKIIRVDLTVDGGKTWHVANIKGQDGSKHPRHWAWSLWEAEIPVQRGTRQVEIWAKAVDSSYNTQPESFENIWNLRGVLSNAYHKVKVQIHRK